jgi:hypothetical protein
MNKFLYKCGIHSYINLFPPDIPNKGLVYALNTLHILGVIVIQLGLLLPPYLLKYYILYIFFLYMSYILLKNKCFMTLLSNYYSGKEYDALCIEMREAKTVLLFLLLASLFFVSYPNWAPYNLIKKYINKV